MDLEPTMIQYDFILIYILITSAETHFLHKVTFTGTGGGDLTISFLGIQYNLEHPVSALPRCLIVQ